VERRNWILMMVLAALWGASYLFIKIGLHDLSPAGIVFARTALAALVLLPLAIRSGGIGQVWRRPGLVFVLAALQVAAPFLLISAGERHIASSLAGILVASAPIFTVLFAVWLDQGERLHGRGLFGALIGIVGVALLLGIDVGGSGAALAGGLMCVLASVGYALGAFALKRWFGGYPPIAMVAGTMSASALMTLPLFLLDPPSHVGLATAGAMSALGIGGTGIAFVIYYTLNHEVGPTRTSLVAYVAPVFAVIYGVALLHEKFSVATAAGVVLILGGSWMAANARTGPVRIRAPRSGRELLGGQLAAGGVDVAAARQAHGRDDAALGQRLLEDIDRGAARSLEASVGRVVGDQVDLEGVARL
jgi:drug/metabolite transporter (DMT)-like permease